MSDSESDGTPLKFVGRQELQSITAVDDESMRDAVVTAAHALLTHEQMADIAVSRGFVERARGMLMLIYDVDDDKALELLELGARRTNVKLHTLARQLTEDLAGLALDRPRERQSKCDKLLSNAHERRISLDEA